MKTLTIPHHSFLDAPLSSYLQRHALRPPPPPPLRFIPIQHHHIPPPQRVSALIISDSIILNYALTPSSLQRALYAERPSPSSHPTTILAAYFKRRIQYEPAGRSVPPTGSATLALSRRARPAGESNEPTREFWKLIEFSPSTKAQKPCSTQWSKTGLQTPPPPTTTGSAVPPPLTPSKRLQQRITPSTRNPPLRRLGAKPNVMLSGLPRRFLGTRMRTGMSSLVTRCWKGGLSWSMWGCLDGLR